MKIKLVKEFRIVSVKTWQLGYAYLELEYVSPNRFKVDSLYILPSKEIAEECTKLKNTSVYSMYDRTGDLVNLFNHRNVDTDLSIDEITGYIERLVNFRDLKKICYYYQYLYAGHTEVGSAKRLCLVIDADGDLVHVVKFSIKRSSVFDPLLDHITSNMFELPSLRITQEEYEERLETHKKILIDVG